MRYNNKPKIIKEVRCGTEEAWEKYKLRYPVSEQVIPGQIYVNETGIILVTSQEWVDWFMGRRENMPIK